MRCSVRPLVLASICPLVHAARHRFPFLLAPRHDCIICLPPTSRMARNVLLPWREKHSPTLLGIGNSCPGLPMSTTAGSLIGVTSENSLNKNIYVRYSKHTNRRGGRAVECIGLENRRAARSRGFESRPLRRCSRVRGTTLGTEMEHLLRC